VGGLQGLAASSLKKNSLPPIFGIDNRLVLARPERHVVIRHLGPADSSGDIAVLLAEDKVVFTGDLAESYLLPPLFSKAIDPDGWLAALGTLSGLHASAVVPGYGPIGPPEAIAVTREYLARTLEIARKIVEEKTPDNAIEMRINEPDMAIAGLPEELKRSHEANVKALVAWLKTPKAAPRK
jgi:glyoxylase-like metal-dependent hydrolase (beta-lactamase superfamily II)